MSSRMIGLVLAILSFGACAADDPSGPDPTPALKTGVWYVHEVGGDPLPALVEEVVTGGATVRTGWCRGRSVPESGCACGRGLR